MIKHNNTCILCNENKNEPLECHHFIKRRKRVLRYNWINGFPLHKYSCHTKVHTKSGEQKLIDFMGKLRFDYLCEMERYTLKQYLYEKCLSREEWEKEIVKELRSIIDKT